jgi:hypothetical protein
MMKVALTAGVTGQDGLYVAELLLEKGYEVHYIHKEKTYDSIISIRPPFRTRSAGLSNLSTRSPGARVSLVSRMMCCLSRQDVCRA